MSISVEFSAEWHAKDISGKGKTFLTSVQCCLAVVCTPTARPYCAINSIVNGRFVTNPLSRFMILPFPALRLSFSPYFLQPE